MDLEKFDDFVRKTCQGDGAGNDIVYALMKLCAESGEAASVVAMLRREGIRAEAGGMQAPDRARLALELGDALWYLVRSCQLLDLRVEDVAELCRVKLEGRRARRGKDPERELLDARTVLCVVDVIRHPD